MRLLNFLFILFLSQSLIAQSRVNKLSVTGMDNFYSLREEFTPLNNVVRIGDGFGITYKTYDTLKNKGMIYEFVTNSTVAYYNNAIGGSALKVDDFHANINFIFPVLILYQRRIEHCFGVGIGIGTLAGRDYYDDHNVALPFNSTNFKKVEFGRYWESSAMLDYEISLRETKRIGTTLGLRYTNTPPIHSNKLAYGFSQGSSLSFKFGFFYQFK